MGRSIVASLVLLSLLYSAAVANEEFLHEEDEYVDSGEDLDGVFFRLGIERSSLSAVVDKKTEIYDFSGSDSGGYSNSTVVYGASGLALDVSVGYESHWDSSDDKGMRYYLNIKLNDEQIAMYDASSKQVALGLEGFRGSPDFHFNYGLLVAIGFSKLSDSRSSSYVDYNDKTIYPAYVAIEPYIGVDGLFAGGFGYYAKLGYEIRDFENTFDIYDASYLDSSGNYVSRSKSQKLDIVTQGMTFGIGLAYRF